MTDEASGKESRLEQAESQSFASEKTKKDKKGEKPGFWSVENLRSLAILILAILAIRSSVASPYHVPTASMEPTIKVGDRLLAWKLAYRLKLPFHDQIEALFASFGVNVDTTLIEWGTPQRGDIIVFKYPREPETDYVKRVVAVAGDEVQIIDDTLYVNGEPQPKTDHNEDRSVLEDIYDYREIKQLYRENLFGLDHWVMHDIPSARRFTSRNWPGPGKGPYKVPEDAVFVIGDNRDNSTDSRVWGHVPLDYVRGKALFVIWSLHSPRDSRWPRLRFSRFGAWLY